MTGNAAKYRTTNYRTHLARPSDGLGWAVAGILLLAFVVAVVVVAVQFAL